MTQIVWEWDGESMTPLPRHARDADREYVVGYRYVMEAFTPADQRSRAAHARYFATVVEYWRNLPERLSGEPWALTADFLRHYALIKCRWVAPEVYTCGTRAEAVRWASMLPRAFNDRGEPVYSVSHVEGSVLTRFLPRSQAYRAMKKTEFQQSSEDVLSFLANLIGARVVGAA